MQLANGKKILACILLTILASGYASAIGVSPGSVKVVNMVRGGYAEKVLTISTAGNEDLTLKIEASGAIKDWISFDPGDKELQLPKKSSMPVTAKIVVPSTTQSGLYEGEVIISTLYTGNETVNVSGARFMPGLIVRVQVTVTGEEITGYEIKSVSVRNTEQNYPLEIVFKIENTGNVVVTPRIHVSLLDVDRKETGKTLDYSGTSILPTIVRQFSVKMPTKGMDVGDYYVKINSDLGDEQILFFQIFPPGAYLVLKGTLDQLMLNKIWVKPQENVKITGTFKNEGELFIESAKLKGEAYLVDKALGTKELVSVFEGDAMSVPIGEEVSLTAYFTPQKPGQYSIEGVALYSGKKTDVKSTVLNVLEEAPRGGYTLQNYSIIGVIIFGFIIIGAAFYVTRIRDSTGGRRPQSSSAVYTTPAGQRKPELPKDAIYRKLKNELQTLKKNAVVLVAVESEQQAEAITALLKIYINEKNMNGLYLSISAPYEQIKNITESAGIQTDRLYFIDCISQMAGTTTAKTEKAVFVENPSSLEEVNMYIDKILMRMPEPKFMFMDSISSLLIYNNERSIEEFTHLVINKMRLEKLGFVIITLKQKESEQLAKTLVPMCDKEIIL